MVSEAAASFMQSKIMEQSTEYVEEQVPFWHLISSARYELFYLSLHHKWVVRRCCSRQVVRCDGIHSNIWRNQKPIFLIPPSKLISQPAHLVPRSLSFLFSFIIILFYVFCVANSQHFGQHDYVPIISKKVTINIRIQMSIANSTDQHQSLR